jgi:hypothetical protein
MEIILSVIQALLSLEYSPQSLKICELKYKPIAVIVDIKIVKIIALIESHEHALGPPQKLEERQEMPTIIIAILNMIYVNNNLEFIVFLSSI